MTINWDNFTWTFAKTMADIPQNFLPTTVFDESIRRINFVFDNCDDIILSTFGDGALRRLGLQLDGERWRSGGQDHHCDSAAKAIRSFAASSGETLTKRARTSRFISALHLGSPAVERKPDRAPARCPGVLLSISIARWPSLP